MQSGGCPPRPACLVSGKRTSRSLDRSKRHAESATKSSKRPCGRAERWRRQDRQSSSCAGLQAVARTLQERRVCTSVFPSSRRRMAAVRARNSVFALRSSSSLRVCPPRLICGARDSQQAMMRSKRSRPCPPRRPRWSTDSAQREDHVPRPNRSCPSRFIRWRTRLEAPGLTCPDRGRRPLSQLG